MEMWEHKVNSVFPRIVYNHVNSVTDEGSIKHPFANLR